MNPYSGEQISNRITVLPSITQNKNLVKYYKNESQYVVKIIGENGKPVGAGTTVSFNINGVFYERQTNASGQAKLTINLNPGKYVITADYNGCRVSNEITVKPTLYAKDLTLNYKDGSKFEVTVLDGQGNPYPNQVVTFNINGVFYERKGDENGISRLAINLNPGQYIITSMHNGLSISNKVTVKEAKPGPTPGPEKTLQQLVDESTGTLKITKDYSNEGDITVNKNLIINGNGHTFSKVRFINDNHDLTLIDSNFKNNYYGGDGGVIYSSGNVNIINSNFSNNRINGDANGIVVYCLGNIDIKDSYFTSSTTDIAYNPKKGSIIYSSGKTTVINTIFEENDKDHSYHIIQGKYIQIHDSIFSKNNARYIRADDGIEITNSIFDHEGAAFSHLETSLPITFNNCSFIDSLDSNSMTFRGNFSNCNFINCSECELYGGSISGCSFVNCSSELGFIEGNACISDCSFVNCSSELGFIGGNNACISDCSFVNCSSEDGFIGGDNVCISDCSFVNCSTIRFDHYMFWLSNSNVSGCSFVNCSSYSTLIYLWNDNHEFSDCSFVNCSTIEGNIIYLGAGNISDCSFVNCSTINGNGSAISTWDGAM